MDGSIQCKLGELSQALKDLRHDLGELKNDLNELDTRLIEMQRDTEKLMQVRGIAVAIGTTFLTAAGAIGVWVIQWFVNEKLLKGG